MTMGLPNLPKELILSIADQTDNLKDLNNLSLTCPEFYNLLNDYLYRRDAESSNPYALFWAASHDRISTADKALSQSTDIRVRGDFYESPSFRLSCEWEPSTDVCLTPMQIALHNRHENMVRFILSHGVGLFEPYPEQYYAVPLHSISYHGPIGLLKLYLDHGANVDERDYKGRTALYCILLCRKYVKFEKELTERVRMLLDYGVDPDAMTITWKSPRKLAKKKCVDELVRSMVVGGRGSTVLLYEAELQARKRWGESSKGNDARTAVMIKDMKELKLNTSYERSKTKKRSKKEEKGDDRVGAGEAEGDQVSTTPVMQLARLDEKTIDATAGRQDAWEKMRAETEQQQQRVWEESQDQDEEPSGCMHASIGLFRKKGKTECVSCKDIVKQSFQCPDCEVMGIWMDENGESVKVWHLTGFSIFDLQQMKLLTQSKHPMHSTTA
ncbi:hypothetical protein AJ79_00500 [Helicocarpus griseus UAMH5409]|uniref:F-box domain-containing protein n=1 Tax=Helicocarpus griseus UAMH5409 TaxID=1447875 RepID=A0A2B7YBK7_9EURO|nr:hypothetical protein AJ79_00500 [Helicocarpus griseus UAMH5409]